MRIAMLLAAATLIGGCTWGPTPDEMPVHARSAYGATVELLVEPSPGEERMVSGELLYVEPDALVVLTDEAIVRVPEDRVRRWQVRRPGRASRAVWGRFTPGEEFVRAARYPRPLTGDQLRALLEAHGFEDVESIASAPDQP